MLLQLLESATSCLQVPLHTDTYTTLLVNNDSTEVDMEVGVNVTSKRCIYTTIATYITIRSSSNIVVVV